MVLTENRRIDDLMKWEVESRGLFTREEATIKNTLGSTATLTAPLGMPVKYVTDHYELLASGEESLCAGLILETKPFTALTNGSTTTTRKLLLVRGPAVINKDELPDSDGAATPVAYTEADLLAALLALGIRCNTDFPRTLTSNS
jgi:hypothetical protein